MFLMAKGLFMSLACVPCSFQIDNPHIRNRWREFLRAAPRKYRIPIHHLCLRLHERLHPMLIEPLHKNHIADRICHQGSFFKTPLVHSSFVPAIAGPHLPSIPPVKRRDEQPANALADRAVRVSRIVHYSSKTCHESVTKIALFCS